MISLASLLDAADAGDLKTVRQLLAQGADAHARTSNGATALHCAAARGNREICELLLDHGLDVNSSDYDGRTVLHFAAFGGSTDVIDLLLARGAFVSAPDDADRKTPLHIAAAQGHSDAINLLIAVGAQVDERDASGRTALWHAAANGHVAAVELLLTLGADVDAADDAGVTPLLAALMDDERDAARLLLSMGASFSVREHQEGLSPLHIAAAHGDREMVELLLNCGANADARSTSGGTPAEAAEAAGHADLAAFLRAVVHSAVLALEEAARPTQHVGMDSVRDGSGASPTSTLAPGSHDVSLSGAGLDVVPGLPDETPPEPDGRLADHIESPTILEFPLDLEEEPADSASPVVPSSATGRDLVEYAAVEMEELPAEAAAPVGVARPLDEGPTPAVSVPSEVVPITGTRWRRLAGGTVRRLAGIMLTLSGAMVGALLLGAVTLVVLTRFHPPQKQQARPGDVTPAARPTAPAAASALMGRPEPTPPLSQARQGPAVAAAPTVRRPRADFPAVTATIVSQPAGATAIIDKGQRRGKTPLVVVLTPGAHDVYVTLPGYRPELQVVQVGSEPLRVFFELKPLLD